MLLHLLRRYFRIETGLPSWPASSIKCSESGSIYVFFIITCRQKTANEYLLSSIRVHKNLTWRISKSLFKLSTKTAHVIITNEKSSFRYIHGFFF